jgi:putative transposase
LEGLKDKSRSGRPPSLVNNNLMIKIRKELEDSNTGWDFKQVMNAIQKKTGIKYHEVHIYRLLHKWGFSARILERIRKNSIQRREKEI